MLNEGADMPPGEWQPADPLDGFGLKEFGVRLRRGELSAEAIASVYVERIRLRDPKIGAFATVVAREAIDAARGVDALLRAETV